MTVDAAMKEFNRAVDAVREAFATLNRDCPHAFREMGDDACAVRMACAALVNACDDACDEPRTFKPEETR